MKAQHHRASGWSFVITPMLDRGWGYDPYVQNLIGRIRAGRPALPCLFDDNSLFLRSGQDTELQRYAAKKREISDAEMAEYRAEAAKRKAAWEVIYAEQRRKAAEEKAERKRAEKEWRARKAEAIKQAEDRLERDRAEWVAAQPQTSKLGSWWPWGDLITVVTGLIASNDTHILVGCGGLPVMVPKSAIRQVKKVWTGSANLDELTVSREVARSMGVEGLEGD